MTFPQSEVWRAHFPPVKAPKTQESGPGENEEIIGVNFMVRF